jgi:hypothetical protein
MVSQQATQKNPLLDECVLMLGFRFTSPPQIIKICGFLLIKISVTLDNIVSVSMY